VPPCSIAALSCDEQYDRAGGTMTKQTPTRAHLAAQRTILVCRTCGGMIWHFDTLETRTSPATGDALLVGYICARCGEHIQIIGLAPRPVA
jgi:RNase P subunit RPR2